MGKTFDGQTGTNVFLTAVTFVKESFQVAGINFFAYGSAGTKHRSKVIVLPIIQKVSSTFINANLRPKSFCLGLIRPKVSFYKC